MSSQSHIPSVMTDDIVISGMSGRFPESDNTDEFANNLFKKVVLFTEDDRRWPTELYGMNQKMAKLKQIDKFDGLYFGLIGLMADQIDPQGRILLETTYEAIVDSGVNPQDLRGSDTGVYIGYSSMGMPDGFPDEVQPDSQSSLTDTIVWYPGSAKCIYANRISFIFDFKGKSMVIDTACSSSVVALDIAINDLRLGKCQQAIVGGVGINLQPFTNHIYQRQQINSKDGIPKVWDEKANGFVRGETVSCIFLQRKSNAKRIYATVLNTGINIDGNKKIGMFFPSTESQEELMVKTYTESGLDPLKINYFEAHGTGTEVGDTQEAKAIFNAYCVRPKRDQPLPIGLLKSNIGHTEAASGLASIVKCLIAFENECIPSNLHMTKIKPSIAEMCPPLMPITTNMPYSPGIAALNNFGLGGVNGHVLLEPNYKLLNDDSFKIADKIPRIVNICCRTEEALNHMFDFIEKNPNKISRDFLALLTDTMKTKPNIKSSGFPYRGTLFIKQVNNEDNQIGYQYKRQSTIFTSKSTKPLWFLFPGLGGQWSGMAKSLMIIDVFAKKIEECHQILSDFDIDLKDLLLSEEKNTMNSMTNKFCATTALQIAMIDVLNELDIRADGIIGHSFGEIACAYADNCLNTREALLVTYIRGKVTESDPKIPKGLMAVVGLSWDETIKLCSEGIDVVCNNADNTVVISGLFEETKKLIQTLIKRNIFVRELDSHFIPYHSKYLKSSAQEMKQNIEKVISVPKKRSNIWISTAILESVPKEETLKYASADYFVHNLVSPVYFYNKLKTQVPNDAVIVEIGPHSLFAKVVSKTLENSTYLSLIRRQQNDTNIETFLTTIGKLYEMGYNPSIERLYPKVEWPVARNTQSISSLVRWQHCDSYLVKKYPDYYFKYTASDMNVKFDMSRNFKSYLPDHCIDGSVLFPATGYLMLAWRQLAASRGRIWNQIPIVFEEVQFRRAVFLSETEPSKLKVRFHDNSGEFVILDNNTVVCLGRCYSPEECPLRIQNVFHQQNIEKELNCELTLDTTDVYKELRAQGYDYGNQFQGIRKFKSKNLSQLFGQIEWNGNWITFLDSLFQTMALTLPFRKLMVPVMISSLRCDPKVFFNAISDYKIVETLEENQKNNCIREVLIENKAEEIPKDVDIFSESNTQILDTMIDSSFHKYKSLLSFYCDIDSKILITNGLEVEDLLAVPISRKSVGSNDLKLESYQFIANYESDAIHPNDKQFIEEYIEVSTFLAKKVKYLINNKNGEQKSDQNCEIEKDVLKKYERDDMRDKILFNTFRQLILKIEENPELVEDIKHLIDDLCEKQSYDLTKDILNNISNYERLLRPLLDIVSENNIPKKEIKVLEMNLSNAFMAKDVDNHLAVAAIYPIDVNYTLAVKSINNLSDDYKNNSFKFCEWDPKVSLFPSDLMNIDLIIFKDHLELWDLNNEDQLQDIHDSLKNSGFVLSFFRYKLTEPEIFMNQINGKKHLNDIILEQRIIEFIENAKKVGFKIICCKTDTIGHKAILLRKIFVKKVKQNQIQSIQIDNNYENWFELLKQKLIQLKEISEENNETKLWLIANDSSINGIIGLTNSLRLEPGGDKIRCIFDYNNNLKVPINSNENEIIDEILSNDLAINVIKGGKLGTYRHLNLAKEFDQKLSFDYFLNVGQTKDLSSLQWFDSKNLFKNEICFDINNKPFKQIRCNIYSSGLNFKDVMFATGRLISGPETMFFDNAIGFEFAGRRSDTGQRVCGFGVSRCMASFIDTSEHLITPIPNNWSMEEAVTVLSTYITVWYGLIERAHLNKKESILIHSGAGGVGQAAISVCQHYNCDIFVTVGTEEKKKFLTEKYGIPENRIFNSRDIQFKYQLMAETNGKGVNLVLNSLTGDKLDSSFQCVSKNGRFVEIGKYDLILNKRIGMFSFLKNISLIGVSVDQIILVLPEYANKFFEWLHQNCNNGCVKPINYTVFKATEADQAFRHMTTGKHIGKILIKIRDEEKYTELSNITFNSTLKMVVTVKTYFDSNKVFIITGGLGGFGLELLNWMIQLGARKFILTSRNGIKSSYQRFFLNRIESLGNKLKIFDTIIKISINDSKTLDSTQKLLEEGLGLGPIGGLFHLSLVLNDCLLENQSLDQFDRTYTSKVNPFLNLDRLTRDMNINLDYFIVFSSVSCGKGNAGQTNYSFANSVVERVCESRHANGLHGLAIQWGPIGDVGVMADTEITNSLSAIVKQRIQSCLEVLDKFLQCSQPILSSTVRAQRLAQEGSREHRIVGQIWNALGVDPNTTPDHLTLGEIGIESMFAIELQQGLEKDYDIKISLSDVKSITVRQMKDFQNGKVNELKQFAFDIRDARTKLNKKKFLIPQETHTFLNGIRVGKPIYFLPPIEGIFSTFESLAKKIDRPVIGLNWTRDMDQLNTIKDLSKHFTSLLNSLSPNQNYDIVGHFYGALIATKMLRKAPIGRAVIIDVLSNAKTDESVNSDDNLFRIVSKFIFHDIPNNVEQRIHRDLSSITDINEKINKLCAEIKEFGGKSLVSRDLDEIMKNSFKRAKLFTNYRTKLLTKYQKVRRNVGKMFFESTGKLLVIKPFDDLTENMTNDVQNIFNSYFIPGEVTKEMMDIEKFQANPDNILFENDDRIANLINKFFNKS